MPLSRINCPVGSILVLVVSQNGEAFWRSLVFLSKAGAAALGPARPHRELAIRVSHLKRQVPRHKSRKPGEDHWLMGTLEQLSWQIINGNWQKSAWLVGGVQQVSEKLINSLARIEHPVMPAESSTCLPNGRGNCANHLDVRNEVCEVLRKATENWR